MDAHVLSLSQIFAVPTFLFTLIRSETILSWNLLLFSVLQTANTQCFFMTKPIPGQESGRISVLHPILRFGIILFAERALFQFKN